MSPTPKGVAAPAVAKTAPVGAVVPPAVRDLAVLVEEVMSIRYCPLAEVELRATKLALRISNAEGHLWELTQARQPVGRR